MRTIVNDYNSEMNSSGKRRNITAKLHFSVNQLKPDILLKKRIK